NTFQQYWQRICREIENGTYHRDLGRAAERFGEVALTAVGKRRQRMFEKGAAKKAERDAARSENPSIAPPPVEESGVQEQPRALARPQPLQAARAPVPQPAPLPPSDHEPLELDMRFDPEPAPRTPRQGFPSVPPPPPASMRPPRVSEPPPPV